MPKKSKRKSTEAAIELLDTSVQEEDAAPDEDVERQELPGEYSARRTCLTLTLTLLSRRFFSSLCSHHRPALPTCRRRSAPSPRAADTDCRGDAWPGRQ